MSPPVADKAPEKDRRPLLNKTFGRSYIKRLARLREMSLIHHMGKKTYPQGGPSVLFTARAGFAFMQMGVFQQLQIS